MKQRQAQAVGYGWCIRLETPYQPSHDGGYMESTRGVLAERWTLHLYPVLPPNVYDDQDEISDPNRYGSARHMVRARKRS